VLDLRGTTACWVWRERYCTKLEGTTVGTGTGGNERIGTGKACRTQCDVDNREAAFMHLQLLKTISQDAFPTHYPKAWSCCLCQSWHNKCCVFAYRHQVHLSPSRKHANQRTQAYTINLSQGIKAVWSAMSQQK